MTGEARKIYLASSWRNPYQPRAVQMLRDAGHEVYDFRNPAPGNTGFAWSEIDPDWLNWTPERFCRGLEHPIAQTGFKFDKDALDWCDTCVLLLPCGRSAHLEAGYAIGQGKQTLIVLDIVRFEPELMYLLADRVVSDIEQMLPALASMRTAEATLRARAEKAEAEREMLAELAAKFAEYGACEICPAAGVTCTESDCAADLERYAAQEVARQAAGKEEGE